MKRSSARWIFPFCCLSLGGISIAQQPAPPPAAAVQGVSGVNENAAARIRNPEIGNAASATANGGVTSAAPNASQGVNKVNGVETINGVKADGRNIIPPPPTAPPPPPPTAPPPPPPPIVNAGGTAVPAGGGSVGTAANIQAVKGVAGINTAKLQNLEKALVLKQGGGGTPTSTEKGGKGKSAAAALLSAPLEQKPKAKEDGRAGFQEFEKLNNGS